MRRNTGYHRPMKALPCPLVAALFLTPILAHAGAVIREAGAVYLEDFMKQPVRLATLGDTNIYYCRSFNRSSRASTCSMPNTHASSRKALMTVARRGRSVRFSKLPWTISG